MQVHQSVVTTRRRRMYTYTTNDACDATLTRTHTHLFAQLCKGSIVYPTETTKPLSTTLHMVDTDAQQHAELTIDERLNASYQQLCAQGYALLSI